jgi:hypothetical protein
MAEVVTIGLDIAKSVFQVHGIDCSSARGPEADRHRKLLSSLT